MEPPQREDLPGPALTSAAARRGRRSAHAARGSAAEPARARRTRSLRPLSRRDVAVAVGACARDPMGRGLPRPVSRATNVSLLGAEPVRGRARPVPSCLPQTTGLQMVI